MADGGEEEKEDLSNLLHGLISVTGRSRAMEDTVKVERELFGGEFQFFAVYDGHGGSRVSDMCREMMHCIVAKEIEGRIIKHGILGVYLSINIYYFP